MSRRGGRGRGGGRGGKQWQSSQAFTFTRVLPRSVQFAPNLRLCRLLENCLDYYAERGSSGMFHTVKKAVRSVVSHGELVTAENCLQLHGVGPKVQEIVEKCLRGEYGEYEGEQQHTAQLLRQQQQSGASAEYLERTSLARDLLGDLDGVRTKGRGKRGRGGGARSAAGSGNNSKKVVYTEHENEVMVRFARRYRGVLPADSLELWKLAAEEQITPFSAKSMQLHFKRTLAVFAQYTDEQCTAAAFGRTVTAVMSGQTPSDTNSSTSGGFSSSSGTAAASSSRFSVSSTSTVSSSSSSSSCSTSSLSSSFPNGSSSSLSDARALYRSTEQISVSSRSSRFTYVSPAAMGVVRRLSSGSANSSSFTSSSPSSLSSLASTTWSTIQATKSSNPPSSGKRPRTDHQPHSSSSTAASSPMVIVLDDSSADESEPATKEVENAYHSSSSSSVSASSSRITATSTPVLSRSTGALPLPSRAITPVFEAATAPLGATATTRVPEQRRIASSSLDRSSSSTVATISSDSFRPSNADSSSSASTETSTTETSTTASTTSSPQTQTTAQPPQRAAKRKRTLTKAATYTAGMTPITPQARFVAERAIGKRSFYSPMQQQLIRHFPDCAALRPCEFARTLCISPQQAANYRVVLVMDTREQGGVDPDLLQRTAAAAGLGFDRAGLAIGDYLFVARPNGVTDPRKDVVLDCVVERKKVSDLVSSVFDDRISEQGSRLARSKLQLFYLIEGKMDESLAFADVSKLRKILQTLELFYGYFVQRTTGFAESVAFLSQLGQQLMEGFTERGISNTYSFGTFQSVLTKNSMYNHRATDFFGQTLLKIDKVGEQRALAVVNRYPTLHALYAAYDNCRSETERKLLLSKVPPVGERSGCVGPKASELIHEHLYKA
mmetsp:Transcript_15736/g.47195  ORF Transcript_15736/g.47195 Transcript_15736/m.47195 type:complete len:895 (+) Transcript_15736:110-2794(+)